MIVKPFNGVYFALLCLTVLMIVGIWAVLRNCSEKTKTAVLVGLCLFNIVSFFVYKVALSRDAAFLEIIGEAQFNWFNELPLQLCNINMFFIPIGVLLKKRFFTGFSFFVAPLGALMALSFPEDAFSGYSLLEPRMIGFYLTHILLLVCGISLATLGFYRPQVRDLPKICGFLLLVALCAHGVNTLLRLNVCPYANYFFTYGSEISILKGMWNLIPVPFLYEMPAILILLAYMGLVSLPFALTEKKKTAAAVSENEPQTVTVE